MNGIPEATPIRLTEEERAELLSLARSTKTEYRMRQRARIVLLAAEGMASRAIGREVGCTTGTASKWRGRYARDRLAGLEWDAMLPGHHVISLRDGRRHAEAAAREFNRIGLPRDLLR